MTKLLAFIRNFNLFFGNSKGVALPMVVFVGGLVAAGGFLLSQSGQLISISGKATTERSVINSVIQDFDTALAGRDECTAARAAGYATIGSYNRGDRVDQVGALEAGTEITVNWPIPAPNLPLAGAIPGGVPLTNVRILTLTFTIDNKVRGVRNVQHDLYIQDFSTNVTEGAGTEDFCMSFQLTGAENSINTFCNARLGGALNADGSCNLDEAGNGVINNAAAFRDRVRELACTIVGGNLVAGRCDVIDVDGPIHSEAFFNDDPNDQIVLDDTATIRSNFQDFNCAVDEVSTGFNEDGSLICEAIDCNATFRNSNIPVFSNYILVDTGAGLQCQCQRDFRFGVNVHNVTLDAPVDPNRYNTGGEPGADMHAMISPWKRPGDYNGSAVSNNQGTVGCNDPDPYSCQDYDWNDGCAMGTTCKILRGRYPGCGVTTTSEQKIIINTCNDICAVGPTCDGTDTNFTTPRADGCIVENDPLPPSITCGGQTLGGNCTVNEAGAGSLAVSGSCSGGMTGTCSADCSATGNWTNVDITSCSSGTSACDGLPDTTEYGNRSSCETGPGPTAKYYTCEVRTGSYCRLGRSCDRSTLSVPNALITSSFGWDDANQPYGGTVACNDSSPAPSVVCNGSTGNYDITGSCGSGVTCSPGSVSWNGGNCQGNISSIYAEGSVVNVVDSTTSMQGDADFECLNTGAWAVESGDPQTCTTVSYNGEYCKRNDLSYSGPGAASGRGITWTPASVSSPQADEPNFYAFNITNFPYSGQACNSEDLFFRSSEGSSSNSDDKYWQCVALGSCPIKDCQNNDSSISFSNASWSTSGITGNGASNPVTCDSGYSGSPTATCNNGSFTTSGSCVAGSTACQDASPYYNNTRYETMNSLPTANRPDINSCKVYCDSLNAFTCNYGPGTTCRPYGPGSPSNASASGTRGTVCGAAPTSTCRINTFEGGGPVLNHITAVLFSGQSTSHSAADDATYSVTCTTSGTPDPDCNRSAVGGTVTYNCL